jgi:hypothetical protein
MLELKAAQSMTKLRYTLSSYGVTQVVHAIIRLRIHSSSVTSAYSKSICLGRC